MSTYCKACGPTVPWVFSTPSPWLVASCCQAGGVYTGSRVGSRRGGVLGVGGSQVKQAPDDRGRVKGCGILIQAGRGLERTMAHNRVELSQAWGRRGVKQPDHLRYTCCGMHIESGMHLGYYCRMNLGRRICVCARSCKSAPSREHREWADSVVCKM